MSPLAASIAAVAAFARPEITLPLEDPILKFLLIMAIVLAAPILLNKLKVPYLLGLIIAGAVIGPHGLNLVLRDSRDRKSTRLNSSHWS